MHVQLHSAVEKIYRNYEGMYIYIFININMRMSKQVTTCTRTYCSNTATHQNDFF